jgi:molybdate transport system substrate-binding protein
MRALPLLAALALLAGASPAPGQAARTLSVAAAANLRPAMDALAAAFEAEHPGVEVAVTAGASGAFFAQIRGGAPFDLFFSADRDYPRRVVEAGLSRGGEVVYAVGKLVVWTPRGSPLDLEGRGLAALADPAVRKIAIGNPAVAPYGRAAEAALASAGVLEAVRSRLVLGQNVSQAAQFAQSGGADAALVPLSLALTPGLREGRVHLVPSSSYPAQEQSALVLRSARDPSLAEAFLAFVTGPRGREVLVRSGYGLPEA